MKIATLGRDSDLGDLGSSFLSFKKHFSIKLVDISTLQANKIHVLGLASL